MCPEYAIELFVVLNEAVNNAFFHGIDNNKGTEVTVSIIKKCFDLTIKVSHNGEGISKQCIDAAATDAYHESGRGLDIMKHYVDALEYSASGCEVIMHKNLGVSSHT